MIFDIKRTSGSYIDPEKPCEEAFQVTRPRVEEWNFASFEEADIASKRWNQPFSKFGTNHKVTSRGTVTREMEMETVWVVDIDSMEALIDFTDKHGEVIVGYGRIEIYDDYRE